MNMFGTGERDMYSGDRHPLASEFWLLLLQEMAVDQFICFPYILNITTLIYFPS